jgi:hypothetical protein
MLSGMGAGGQEQNGRAADPVSSWECSKVILRREEIGGFVVPTFTKNVKVGQPPVTVIAFLFSYIFSTSQYSDTSKTVPQP